MNLNFKIPSIALACLLLPTACINGATYNHHNSSLGYEEYNCSQLASKHKSLDTSESQLVATQKQRGNGNKADTPWMGYSRSDIEVSEIANVRDQKKAVLQAMNAKRCTI